MCEFLIGYLSAFKYQYDRHSYWTVTASDINVDRRVLAYLLCSDSDDFGFFVLSQKGGSDSFIVGDSLSLIKIGLIVDQDILFLVSR